MTRTARPDRVVPALLAALVALVVLVGTLTASVVQAPTAQAAARVSVANEVGRAEASDTSATTLQVSGAGFQSVQGGFGGIYVFFGWVADSGAGAWAPSRGGAVGSDYRYVPDSESADNHGYQRFVAFPGSDTEASANGGLLASDGTWSTALVVPGPTFDAQDRSGAVTTVDCREVQCGVITIGAHGVRNATNESFTPVTFVGAESAEPAPVGPAGDDPTSAGDDQEPATAGPGDDEPGTADPSKPQTARVGIDQATAVAGHALSFAGQGFEPGEQVVALLDDGLLAVGPLNAGNHGEVAGILELPDDLRAGTHVLRLTGASSGSAPEAEVTVLRDPAAVSAAEAQADAAAAAVDESYTPAELAVLAAGLVLLVVVVSSFVAARRRRRSVPAHTATVPAPETPFPETAVPAPPALEAHTAPYEAAHR